MTSINNYDSSPTGYSEDSFTRKRFNSKFQASNASIDSREDFHISPPDSDSIHLNLPNNGPTFPSYLSYGQPDQSLAPDSCSEYEGAIDTDKENLDPSKFVFSNATSFSNLSCSPTKIATNLNSHVLVQS